MRINIFNKASQKKIVTSVVGKLKLKFINLKQSNEKWLFVTWFIPLGI